MSKRSTISGPVKDPTGNYPKLLRLLDQYFLKEAIPDRAAVTALATLARVNGAVLAQPDRVNLRALRTRDQDVQTLIEYGGTDILTQIGWRFRVSGMEETWQLPYDADLTVLAEHQAKILEAQQTLQRRFDATRQEASSVQAKEKQAKAAIVRQIEQDAAERKVQQAMRKGEAVPVKQSLDEMRKQAVKERLARQKKQQEDAADAAASLGGDQADKAPAQLPGSFPSAASVAVSQGPSQGVGYDHPDDEPEDMDDDEEDYDEDMEDDALMPPSRPGQISVSSSVHRTGLRSRGGPGPPQRPRRTQPKPIEVGKKVPPKERYQAGTHTLGGESSDAL